jgi:hypothetical protein
VAKDDQNTEIPNPTGKMGRATFELRQIKAVSRALN